MIDGCSGTASTVDRRLWCAALLAMLSPGSLAAPPSPCGGPCAADTLGRIEAARESLAERLADVPTSVRQPYLVTFALGTRTGDALAALQTAGTRVTELYHCARELCIGVPVPRGDASVVAAAFHSELLSQLEHAERMRDSDAFNELVDPAAIHWETQEAEAIRVLREDLFRHDSPLLTAARFEADSHSLAAVAAFVKPEVVAIEAMPRAHVMPIVLQPFAPLPDSLRLPAE